ncbi:flavonol reductase [Penicillium riverlandense]|uniref:flavonol reductase n=1 Tax=Penicillium riverlandense TaxID=1903569 RepID=UPI002547248F|nr:flavonol reductase [Penicillium riverlandense]KAJ5811735.1 flavonol reductase [Penicillium riverlandense]
MKDQGAILVTGASGFVATHIVDVFLKAGYAVRGTVRSQATADKVRKTFPAFNERLSFAIVPDMTAPNSFDEAVQGVIGVIHTATPFKLSVEDNERDLLQPAIHGTISILQSIQKFSPLVKRVVITSSFMAIRDPNKGTRPGYTYSEADWNPTTYEEAAKKDASASFAYAAAKTLAERKAWDFIETESPPFDLVTICPPMVFGPNKNATADLTRLNTSSQQIYGLISPKGHPSDPIPPNSSWSWVDVRDVAFAHLRAFQIPDAGGHRFLVCGGNFSFQQMADILRKKVPEVRNRLPTGNPGSGFGKVELYIPDSSKAVTILGIQFRDLEETVVDSARSLLRLED